jgi:hypothetical protein
VELWQASPGDKLRIPRHFPEVVTVTDAGYGDYRHDRLSWEAPGWSGTTTLPRAMRVELLATGDVTRQALVGTGLAGASGEAREAQVEAAMAALLATIEDGKG